MIFVRRFIGLRWLACGGWPVILAFEMLHGLRPLTEREN